MECNSKHLRSVYRRRCSEIILLCDVGREVPVIAQSTWTHRRRPKSQTFQRLMTFRGTRLNTPAAQPMTV